jgi:hypothetical protein
MSDDSADGELGVIITEAGQDARGSITFTPLAA